VPVVAAPLVLVVEDDPNVRGLLSTLLGAEGYQVAIASDGVAGLVKAAAQRPALILLDLMMPDLGGARVLEELSADPALADVPVIVVTGKLDAVPGLREVLGETSVFAKPFSVADLLARVAEVTGGPPPPGGGHGGRDGTGRRTGEEGT
jgi:CheY-like chemotaxis protein